MSINIRLQGFLDENDWRARDLAERCNLPVRSIYQYLRGARSPSAEALQKLAENTPIDLNWLLTGYPVGSFERERSNENAPSTQGSEPVESRLEVEEKVDEEAKKLFLQQMEQLFIAASAGNSAGLWYTMHALSDGSEYTVKELTLILSKISKETESNVRRHLALLRSYGLVSEAGSKWEQSPNLGVLKRKPRDETNVSTAGIEAIRQIALNIVPAAKRGHGKLISAVMWVPKGCGHNVSLESAKLLKEYWANLAETQPQTEGEEVSLVLGIAVNAVNMHNTVPRVSEF